MKLLITTQVVDKNHPILGFFHGWLEEFATVAEEVHVICLEEGTHTLPAHVFVYSLGKEAGAGRLTYVWRFYRYFVNIFFRVRVKYVFFHMGGIYNLLAAPFFLVRRLYGTRFYWWKAHGHLSRKDRFAGWVVDRIYTSTMSGYPIETKKRAVIGQAIDSSLFTYSPAQAREKTILYVGRLTPIKHLEIFCETVAELQPEGYRGVVIGPLDESAYAKQLLQQFQETGIEYLGPQTQTELVAHYQQAAIFLNPSLTNSMDKTVLEAALCGALPLTANPAFAELLSPLGLLANEQTAHTYAHMIRELSKQDANELRAQLRESVATTHSLKTFAKRIFLYD